MPTRLFILGLAAALLTTPFAQSDEPDFAFHHENVMGTSMELRVRADDPKAARGAERRILAEIDRLSRILSGYDAASEFSRWQADVGERRVVSPELYAMLSASDAWRERSGGAFDPRVEVFTRLWSRTSREGRTPTATEQTAALASLAHPAWRIEPATRTAERLTDAPLTLNAIAKGEIVERACDSALAGDAKVRGLVLNIGGDLRVCGEITQPIAIVDPNDDNESAEPSHRIAVRNRAVATSGHSQRYFEVGGRRYSHIFDPRTGRPVEDVAAATVIAERSADADALATILNVLSPEEGRKLVEATPGTACRIVAADGRVTTSRGWKAYEEPTPVLAVARLDDPAPKAAEPEDAWGKSFEMTVDFEIAKPGAEANRYRRPYVAIWVEDKDGFPVRNLLLWVSQGGAGPFQWAPDMRRWHRADQLRKKTDRREMIFVMSRPTRPPGKYSTVWDGKNDLGKFVPPGEYTVYIDTAREHATYQNLKKTITIGPEPFTADMGSNEEVKSAGIDYHRKPTGK